MRTDGYTGAFKARPEKAGAGAQVVRMKDDQSYADLLVARFADLSDYGGPGALELAAEYAEQLNRREAEATGRS